MIKVMIVVAYVSVIAAVTFNIINHKKTSCISGFIFVNTYRGNVTQLLNEKGQGVPCN